MAEAIVKTVCSEKTLFGTGRVRNPSLNRIRDDPLTPGLI
jgi:hypothetical protein